MLITGKLIGSGRYTMTRVIAPMRKPLPLSYQIEISEKTQVYENDKNITDEIRHLEFQKDNVVFLWRKPSKVGLPYKLALI